MEYKINVGKIIFALTITALCQPLGAYGVPIAHDLYSLGKILALIYATYLILTKRVRLDRFIVSVLALLTFLLVPTFVNSGDIRVWFMQFYLYGSTCIILQFWIRKDMHYTVKCIASVLSMILLVNLITFFQNGIDYAENSEASISYLIGIRTRIGDIAYLAYAVSLFGLLISKRKKLQLYVPISIFSSLYFIIINRVSTSLLCTVVFAIVIILSLKFVKVIKRSIFIVFLGSILTSVLIIFTKIQNKFSWLIEDILHESLTLNGRTFIWDSVLAQMPGYWGIGHGLGVEKSFNILIGYTTGTHNQFMDILFNGGIIGLALFINMVYAAITKLQNTTEKMAISILSSAIVAYSISMISEVMSSSVYFYILLTLCANAQYIKRNTK
ncbi:O-antigen ligase family protein [Neobacillus niacini]|uniref:O-antigen ligase family protein n=1 Tax=Neobacillus niacini TaxID=86668 RepID=UPI002FFF1FF5